MDKNAIDKVSAKGFAQATGLSREDAVVVLNGLEACGKATRCGLRSTYRVNPDGTLSAQRGRKAILFAVSVEALCALFDMDKVDALARITDHEALEADALDAQFAAQPKATPTKSEGGETTTVAETTANEVAA